MFQKCRVLGLKILDIPDIPDIPDILDCLKWVIMRKNLLLRKTPKQNGHCTQIKDGQFAPGQFAPGQFTPSQFAPSQFAPGQFAPFRKISIFHQKSVDSPLVSSPPVSSPLILRGEWGWTYEGWIDCEPSFLELGPANSLLLNHYCEFIQLTLLIYKSAVNSTAIGKDTPPRQCCATRRGKMAG